MPIKTVLIRLLLAILVGGVVGSERENKNSPAGFRTHILVCLGTTIISLISLEMLAASLLLIKQNPLGANVVKVDVGRLGAQAITGIGFLGAGTIIQSKGLIRGLTTAATLWVVAVIGLATGMGYYRIVIWGTVAVFLTLVTLKKFQKKYMMRPKVETIEVYFNDEAKGASFIDYYFSTHNMVVEEVQRCYDPKRRFEPDAEVIRGSRYSFHLPSNSTIQGIMGDLNRELSVERVRYRADLKGGDLLN
ncbi:MgtC/SapB family protein [uncultured Vagococcus sp.]|uniref:MgtC/SapB family protein n=1 Tax=uncultured Vagococcus sp. TaxID=189676 RepID=UPI0028D24080|nr:MgtC/SapB family protein [uncultured Vagococcus sp.]